MLSLLSLGSMLHFASSFASTTVEGEDAAGSSDVVPSHRGDQPEFVAIPSVRTDSVDLVPAGRRPYVAFRLDFIPELDGPAQKLAVLCHSILLEQLIDGCQAIESVVGVMNIARRHEPTSILEKATPMCLILHTATGHSWKASPYLDVHAALLAVDSKARSAAAATTILFGPIGLLMLFSNKRQHCLTLSFKDADGKDIVRTTLPIVETRSGKKVECQDDEATKSAR